MRDAETHNDIKRAAATFVTGYSLCNLLINTLHTVSCDLADYYAASERWRHK